MPSGSERLLLVDDDLLVLRLFHHILTPLGYSTEQAQSPAQALDLLARERFDAMLCDVEMPGGSGLDLIDRALVLDPQMAVVMVSGLDEVSLADRALESGAYGYVVKPFTANDLVRGVLGALSRRRERVDAAASLEAAHEETIRRLCMAVEARDQETATHINEMSELCARIASELGLPAERCRLIRTAGAMHDVGKIGIPDGILLKRGVLTADERVTMHAHAEIGYRILAGSGAELLEMAAMIAWTHHERYDGTGYPRGLAGDEIPLDGRIAAVADVFDALTRDRVYRPRFSHDDAVEMMSDGRGSHFDPDVLDAFTATLSHERITA